MISQIQEKLVRRKEVLAGVRMMLVENLHLPVEPNEIDPDVSLFGSGLALDSVDAVEIIVALESRFDMKFPDANAPAPAGSEAIPSKDSPGVARLALRTVNTLVDTVIWLQDQQQGKDLLSAAALVDAEGGGE